MGWDEEKVQVLSQHWEWVSEGGWVSEVRSALMGKAEERTARSLVTKLSSALALLAVQAVPDLWENPIQDFIQRWALADPVLLLRVLSEIPSQVRKVRH